MAAFPPWRRRGLPSLALRILLVNLLALLGLFGAVLYIDSFRARLVAVREAELVTQGRLLAGLLAGRGEAEARALVEELSVPQGHRIRLFDSHGRLLADNWRNPAVARFTLEDPTTEGFRRWSARLIDRVVDTLSRTAELPPWVETEGRGRADRWPFVDPATLAAGATARATRTEDRAIVVEAAVPLPRDAAGGGGVLVLTAATGDLVETVRQERAEAFRLLLVLVLAGLALSLYLARTIVRPLGELALAAQRVRRGRAREVSIPRWPERQDEIGRLARALADMTDALRRRIDETEAFAAEVSHELRNPLASLRSAVEALDTVRDPADRARLFQLIRDDVGRIDRLIQDISAASRIEAELTRARPEPLDLGPLVQHVVATLAATAPWQTQVRLEAETPPPGEAVVMAARGRLEQVIVNLVENAASFSPPGGRVLVGVRREGADVVMEVIDDGPGIPSELRKAVFTRFWSDRPEGFGRHSGLGLSIVKAIVEAFDGTVTVVDRTDGRPGACLRVHLPAAAPPPPRGGGALASPEACAP
ncbi:MAG: sensor histidine kinase [Sphingomonadaceae bacterium]|uniref:sensor histidine kinase n=1 Tax=Thermaurantiacus sp. TaxID=2820283 RepID=UPI00298F1037|nr:ATP-binding protein [Thermaurantiacus sp.]MCS6986628.1 sensor histidine kinase [Sphingomonadaceae bacterium]MDW8414111.1 ATP-binding protein [Thermaurantiacus sp.]